MTPRPALEELLALPLFADVHASELDGLEAHWTIAGYRRGEHVFSRGDDGDALYVVLSGQVAMQLDGALLGLCGPSDWFGEMALLGRGVRSADARVMIDATLLRIDRDGWAAIGARAPQVFSRVCERLATHLRRQNTPAAAARRGVVACVDANGWLPALVASIRRQFPDRELHVLAADGSDVTDGVERAAGIRSAPGTLAHAITRFVALDALVLIAADDAGGIADRTVRRSTLAKWVIESESRDRPLELVRAASTEAALDRVARRIMGGTIGIALGAGGAYGFAHLGFLAVLERERIPVDVVAGSSMGAIIGAVVAAGIPADRAVAYAGTVASRFRRIVLRDLDVRGRTLLTGASIPRIIEEFEELRTETFEGLMLPFEAVAMDIGSGAQVILDSGPVIAGIQPSFAMPGIFPACVRDGRRLVDGAMVNPVPVDRVRALGADVVIAAQPIAQLDDGAANPLDHLLGRGQRLLDWIPLGPLRSGVDTLSVSLRSFQSLWYRLATASAGTADVVFAPELRRYWFLQFGAAAEIIEAGRRHTETILPELRATLRARTGLVV